MSNVNPQSMSDEEALRPKLGSRDGKLLRSALGVLCLALVLVLVAWYWPLHRAHAELRGEFAKASETAKSLRTKLEKTLGILESTTKVRDALNQKEAQRRAAADERVKTIDALYEAIEAKVKPNIGKKQVSLEKHGTSFSLTLQNNALQKEDSVDLTRTGATVLCRALEPLKTAESVRVRLLGLGTDAQSKSRLLKPYPSGLEVGAARAARAARIAAKCGAGTRTLTVEGAIPPKNAANHTLRLVVEAEQACEG